MEENILLGDGKTTCVACGREDIYLSRGRCQPCYRMAFKLIKRKITSWEFLESAGFAMSIIGGNHKGSKEVKDGE